MNVKLIVPFWLITFELYEEFMKFIYLFTYNFVFIMRTVYDSHLNFAVAKFNKNGKNTKIRKELPNVDTLIDFKLHEAVTKNAQS